MLNTLTWVIWLTSALVLIWSTRNPVYLCLILAALITVWSSVENRVKLQYAEESSAVPFSPIRIIVFIILFSALFNGLISHYGGTVVFYIPGWMPYLGGPVTLEGMVFGAINGLVLSDILIAFMIVNLSLPVRSLIRLIPRAFYPLAVVTSIAITFLPNTTRQVQQIRESQAIRGHRVRGLKDWLPLIMPLLIGGLERAMGLAETMTARGFAGDRIEKQPANYRIGFLLGLFFFLTGWVIQLTNAVPMLGTGTVAAGLILIAYTFWKLGRSTQRSRYRREAWAARDVIVIITSLSLLLIYFLPYPLLDNSSLSYNPYPVLTVPDFDFIIGLACMSLVMPALFNIRKTGIELNA